MDTTFVPPDFKEFLQLLNAKNVEYLVVGGFAVSHHGYSRYTGDIDVWVAINDSNAEKISAALKEFGFSQDVSSLLLQPEKIIRMGVEPLRIEIHTSIDGVSFSECFAEKIDDDLDDVPTSFISLKRLRENKEASGRFKDLSDLENLPPAP